MARKSAARHPALVLGAAAALVVVAFCLPRVKPPPVVARPGEVVPGMDQAQVRGAVGEPLEELRMADKSGVDMDAWTYPRCRVYFTGGYVKKVVPLDDSD